MTSAVVSDGIRFKKLKDTLTVVKAVIDDEEKKQITGSDVNSWLNVLKDTVYEADDLVDEISTQAATQKEVSNFSNGNMVSISELEDMVDRLEHVLRLNKILDLKEIAKVPWKVPSTSLEDGSHIYGRDKDKGFIIKLLLEDCREGEQVSVIPIVGMGGVGKTTLAQSLYNDDNLKKMFDLKAWVCVSQEFDILKVTKTMVEEVTRKPCILNDLNSLQLDLMDKLKDTKFLIILDDLWIEDDVNWSRLKEPFQHGIRGSKILVTTHNENVAFVVRTVQAYHLNQMSNEDCRLVFANHACLSSESSENITTVEKIGREIVKKCNGLPLAAQSLGGMLRSKRGVEDWNNILNSDVWQLSESQCDIIPSLRINYHYLPSHLKRCFVYCSLYPKGYEFQKNELILLWMAEDLIKPPKRGKTLEEVGCEYFDYLVSRSFFQHSSTKTLGNYFVMHDLMHDLATSLGGEFYFKSKELGNETNINTMTRHLSFTKFSDSVSDNFEVFGRAKFLRTLLPINFEVSSFHNEKAPCIIISNPMYLRVLSFCAFPGLDALPDSIGKLTHLRYLNLSRTSVERLPESLCNLYNLQTLKLSHCFKLTKLPRGMQNLVNLRHLHIDGTSIEDMPRGMGKLNHLQHLDFFIVGKHEENGIKELGGLSNLHGPLSIRNLENVIKSEEALEARIMDKKHIDSLSLQWSGCYNSIASQIEIDALCKLQPQLNLKLLSIDGYKGTKFPNWVGNFSYSNMTHLRLNNCDNCCMLPSLGQLPFLKNLHISKLNMVEIIDAGFYHNEDCSLLTPFPSLESLTFYDMPSWEVWSYFQSDAFPLLKHLNILGCPRLMGDLPNRLPSLKCLTIKDCNKLKSLPDQMSTLLSNLKYLHLNNCPKIIPNSWH